jgi:integrase
MPRGGNHAPANIPRMKSKRRYERLTDRDIEILRHFDDDPITGEPLPARVVWDRVVPGLHARIGRNRTTFVFQKEHQTHGKRGVTFRRLGFFPAMRVADARKLALIEAAKVAAGRIEPGKKSALKVDAALDSYIEHLKGRPKGQTWARNVESISRVHIRPEFGSWPLAELAVVPARIQEWHKKITKRSGPVAADHAAKVLRASFRRAARLDRSLPPFNPTSAVEYNPQRRSQKALAFKDFPKWLRAWEKIDSPTRRAFQMINLLCGARPGELARLQWKDVLPRERCFVIRSAKIGDDIRVAFSLPIVRELKRARDAAIEGNPYVFPARAGGHIVKFDVDQLPAWGMMYRRTWRTVAADVGVDELIAHFSLGHVPAGISRGYVAKMILSSGSAIRKAQRDVSRRMQELMSK